MDKPPKQINKMVWLITFLIAKNTRAMSNPKNKKNFTISPSINDFLSVAIALTKSFAGVSKAAFWFASGILAIWLSKLNSLSLLKLLVKYMYSTVASTKPVRIKLGLYFFTMVLKSVSSLIAAIPYKAITPNKRVGIIIIILGALNLL